MFDFSPKGLGSETDQLPLEGEHSVSKKLLTILQATW